MDTSYVALVKVVFVHLISHVTNSTPGVETSYPFSSTVQLEAGASLVVWSSNAGVTHRPRDGRFVMKEGVWRIGPTIHTVLINDKGLEIASRKTVMENSSVGSSRYSSTLIDEHFR